MRLLEKKNHERERETSEREKERAPGVEASDLGQNRLALVPLLPSCPGSD